MRRRFRQGHMCGGQINADQGPFRERNIDQLGLRMGRYRNDRKMAVSKCVIFVFCAIFFVIDFLHQSDAEKFLLIQCLTK